MSLGIIGSTIIVRNPDLKATITIGMPKLQLEGNLRANIHATVWSALSHSILE